MVLRWLVDSRPLGSCLGEILREVNLKRKSLRKIYEYIKQLKMFNIYIKVKCMDTFNRMANYTSLVVES